MQPRTLLEALEFSFVNKLRAIYDVLGGNNEPRPARKDQLVSAINRILLTRVEAEWNSLTKLEKLVVREAVHDPTGRFDVDRFTAKHGKAPSNRFAVSRHNVSNTATKLNLFLHLGDRHDPQIWIPRDLQQSMKGFVPEPEEPAVRFLAELPPTVELVSYPYVYKSGKYVRVATSSTVPIEWRNMEATAKSGLLAVLSLIDEGKISVSASTKRPSQASMKRIAGALVGGDFYASTESEAEVGPIQAFAWPLLLQAGRLARAGRFPARAYGGRAKGVVGAAARDAQGYLEPLALNQDHRRVLQDRGDKGADPWPGQVSHESGGMATRRDRRRARVCVRTVASFRSTTSPSS